ncbi:MAG TPA: hypothetical protein VGE74_05195 [Gemmata sp.]
MADRVFCMDFGAAYTKVALRTAAQESADLVPLLPSARDFWAPTVVAANWNTGRPKPDLEFGEKAAGIKPGDRVTVYTNFKRGLFAPAGADKPEMHPLDALLHSAEFEALAAKYSVQPAWVAGLRQMVGSARSMLGLPDAAGHAEARKQDEAKTVAHYYFRWLHEQVMQACERLPHTALNYRDIPLRVSVPVLGADADLDAHPGCVRLREALTSTGWKLDARPFVSEPEANAVGVLTKAANALTKRKRINFGEMFGKGPLVTVIKGDKDHPTYRALVIDVGAFTTDFAALSIDTGGKSLDAEFGAGFVALPRSVPFGTTDLDASVRAALAEDKRAALDALAPKDFAEFQVRTYTDETGFRIGPGKVIGGPADQPVIRPCLDTFTKHLADEAEAFLQQLGPASMQELILTGGGSNIPAVRDALIAAASRVPGSSFVKTHAPGLKKSKAGPPVDPLDDKFARGGSALGGASIYFEKSYY